MLISIKEQFKGKRKSKSLTENTNTLGCNGFELEKNHLDRRSISISRNEVINIDLLHD